MADRKLTARQEKFINVYLMTGNATKSALEAGYSRKTACSIGEENLRKPEIQAVIEQRNRQLTKKAEISQERLLTEFLRLGLSNMADYVTWDAEGHVRIKPMEELTRGQMAAIQSIESQTDSREIDGVTYTTYKLKFKLHPKEGPLNKLGEKYNLFPKPAENGNTNIQFNNYHQANDPFNVAALNVEEQGKLSELLEKAMVVPT